MGASTSHRKPIVAADAGLPEKLSLKWTGGDVDRQLMLQFYCAFD